MGTINRKLNLQIIFYSTIMFFLYLGLSNSGEATDSKPFAELSEIVAVMEKQDIEMRNWTLYTRERLSSWETLDEYQDELASIQNKTIDYTWETETTNANHGQKKTIGTLKHIELGITETLTYIVFPHNEQFHSYLTYEVEGNHFSEDINQTFSAIILSRLEDLFLPNTKIFTCTTGNSSDKINIGLQQQAERILADFSARKIEFLKEETFISISAYTNTWNKAIVTNNQKMNLQVAIREDQRLGGETTVTIGTPIITTEY